MALFVRRCRCRGASATSRITHAIYNATEGTLPLGSARPYRVVEEMEHQDCREGLSGPVANVPIRAAKPPVVHTDTTATSSLEPSVPERQHNQSRFALGWRGWRTRLRPARLGGTSWAPARWGLGSLSIRCGRIDFMAPSRRLFRTCLLSFAALLFLSSPELCRNSTAVAAEERTEDRTADTTWVDHDGRPIRRPPDWEPPFWGNQIREIVFDPLTHILDVPDKLLLVPRVLGARTRREAVNVNDFDEVPNSTWFTNRNHARAVPVAALALGPDSVVFPTKPWTIKHRKQGGRSVGFQIKDAGGRKWLVKVDPAGFPELGSGADMVARTLFHAAGYNVPHNEPITFNRDDLKIDSELLHAKPGERFTESDLDSMLVRGARLPDGSYSGYASRFLPGHPLGAPSL